jgi:hypothetical protein
VGEVRVFVGVGVGVSVGVGVFVGVGVGVLLARINGLLFANNIQPFLFPILVVFTYKNEPVPV